MTPSRSSPWQWLPEAALKQRQIDALRLYLRNTVIPFSEYYRERFQQAHFDPLQLRTWEDLQRVPFTSKADFAGSAEVVRRFVLKPDQRALTHRISTVFHALLRGRAAVRASFEREFRPILMTSTTGRSADPVPFVYTSHDIDVLRTAGLRVMEICGAKVEHRMINMFPYAPHLAFWQTHYAGTEFGVFVLGSGGGKVMGTEGNLRLIRKIGPDVLIGMPTFIYHVLTEAVAEGAKLPNLTKIVLGGEKVPFGMRRKLRKLAIEAGSPHVDILGTYGFTEAKMAWPECPYPEDSVSGGYHLSPELGIVEIVDPDTGEPVPAGQGGEIVFTPLEARGSVVIRYRTGDIIDGGVVFEACPHCGRRLPRLVGNISRKSEVKEMHLEKLKGTLVDFNALEHVLDDCEWVDTWQLELRKRHDDPLDLDELILHVQKPRRVGLDRFRHELDELFAARTEIHPNRIVCHSEEEMRSLQGVGTQLKEMRIVDHRPVNTNTPLNGAPLVHTIDGQSTLLAMKPGRRTTKTSK